MVEVKGLNPSHPATNSIEMATEHHDNDVRAFARDAIKVQVIHFSS